MMYCNSTLYIGKPIDKFSLYLPGTGVLLTTHTIHVHQIIDNMYHNIHKLKIKRKNNIESGYAKSFVISCVVLMLSTCFDS